MPSKDFAPQPSSAPPASILAGLAILLGIVLLSYGSWLAWHPLGFITGGLSILGLGVLMGRNAARQRRLSL